MTDAPRAVGLDGGLERLDQRPFRAEHHRHVAAAGKLEDASGCSSATWRAGTFPPTQVTAMSSISGDAHA